VSYNRELKLVVKEKDQVVPQREETARGDAGARRRAWVLGTAIALVGLAVGAVFGDRGILNLLQKRQQVDALRLQIEDLRSGNVQLAAEVAALRSSPRAVEQVAREQLGLAREDETVFLLRSPEARSRP
jgi:cell division protein FtsB